MEVGGILTEQLSPTAVTYRRSEDVGHIKTTGPAPWSVRRINNIAVRPSVDGRASGRAVVSRVQLCPAGQRSALLRNHAVVVVVGEIRRTSSTSALIYNCQWRRRTTDQPTAC